MKNSLILALGAAIVSVFSGASALAVDEDAAKALLKKSDCTKCHAVDKSKKGPSYKKVAEKWKGKADAEAKLRTRKALMPRHSGRTPWF